MKRRTASTSMSCARRGARGRRVRQGGHLLGYADPDAYGLRARVEVTFVQLGDPREESSAGLVARQNFVTEAGKNLVRAV
ncbi:MAG: hypothetical protein IPQ09_08970 [Myxococcales bacterium]|nr:hypothetical protein [Myxococcales bacterium]